MASVLNRIFLGLLFCALTTGIQAQDFHFIPIAAATYKVGKKGHVLNPLRKVTLSSFSISDKETTNEQFEAFVNATGYITDAERNHNALIFIPGLEEFKWKEDSTANWRFPNGIERGGIEGRMNHPVTTISYSDIQAYCKWAKVRLPSLVEWEVAARAGSTTDYFFAKTADSVSVYGNIWKGIDHLKADSTDGYMYTAPVGSFAPNAWGLYDVYGNVFEFCSGKLKPNESSSIAHARGGSWWCSVHACGFFNSFDIGRVNVHASFSNQGFRVVK